LIFEPTRIAGVVIVQPERRADERGFFARTWCREEFEAHGLNPRLVQCNVSFNHRRGTVRGMHWQRDPHGECKLVRCTAGAILDVVVDLRPGSVTYRQSIAVELSAENRHALYIPEGLAHGFQTLTDSVEVLYQMSTDHHPESATGARWNDPAIQVAWPLPISVISARDESWPVLP